MLILICIIPLALFEMRPVELDLMFPKRFSTRGIEIVIDLSIQQQNYITHRFTFCYFL